MVRLLVLGLLMLATVTGLHRGWLVIRWCQVVHDLAGPVLAGQAADCPRL
ncbi:MAG: hypothetical protein ACKOCM_05850 [Cyanobacteriota bacterium]